MNEEFRRLASPNGTAKYLFFGGKGGVGKTTVAVNLALALKQLGSRVGLFDADLYGPNVPLMLGVHRKESAKGFIPVARSGRDPYIPPLERFGLKTMSIGFVIGESTPIIPDSVLAGQVIRQTLRDVLWGELDCLLIDLPPGTGEPQQTLLQSIQIDGALIVTTPQDLSLLDAVYPWVAPGGLVLAHDICVPRFREDLAEYQAAVRDRARFARSVPLEIDPCGLEVSVKAAAPLGDGPG